jgi:hypothetical protein
MNRKYPRKTPYPNLRERETPARLRTQMGCPQVPRAALRANLASGSYLSSIKVDWYVVRVSWIMSASASATDIRRRSKVLAGCHEQMCGRIPSKLLLPCPVLRQLKRAEKRTLCDNSDRNLTRGERSAPRTSISSHANFWLWLRRSCVGNIGLAVRRKISRQAGARDSAAGNAIWNREPDGQAGTIPRHADNKTRHAARRDGHRYRARVWGRGTDHRGGACRRR